MVPHVGRDLIAGVRFVKLHSVRPQRRSLQSAVCALQGWVKDCPTSSCLPLPEGVVRNQLQGALRHPTPRSAHRHKLEGCLSHMTAELPEHKVQNVHERLKAKWAQL